MSSHPFVNERSPPSDDRFEMERVNLLTILSEERPEFPSRSWFARHRRASVRLAMLESDDLAVRDMIVWTDKGPFARSSAP